MTEIINNTDPIYNYIGKITFVKTVEREYSAKLTEVNGDELWFESKNGYTWMQSRKQLLYIGLIVKKQVV